MRLQKRATYYTSSVRERFPFFPNYTAAKSRQNCIVRNTHTHTHTPIAYKLTVKGNVRREILAGRPRSNVSLEGFNPGLGRLCELRHVSQRLDSRGEPSMSGYPNSNFDDPARARNPIATRLCPDTIGIIPFQVSAIRLIPDEISDPAARSGRF